jgi:hypothetical protein
MGVNPGGHVAELPAQATPHHSLEVPSLSGGARVKIAFYTTTCWTPMRIEDGKQIPIENPDAVVPKNELRFYLEGTYQFILRGEYVASGFFVPLIYSYTERTVKSLPIQESSEPWNVIRTLLFPGFQLQT